MYLNESVTHELKRFSGALTCFRASFFFFGERADGMYKQKKIKNLTTHNANDV